MTTSNSDPPGDPSPAEEDARIRDMQTMRLLIREYGLKRAREMWNAPGIDYSADETARLERERLVESLRKYPDPLPAWASARDPDESPRLRRFYERCERRDNER